MRISWSDIVIYGSQLVMGFGIEWLLRPHVAYEPARLLVTFAIVIVLDVLFLGFYSYRFGR